ncbi:hypothetical protein FRC08_009538 [Ceratobasidium sp. 394]|nr:hypothetical protein FRC08_009538 [Ceratobasidium sp. 394]
MIGMEFSIGIWTGERSLLKEFRFNNFRLSNMAVSADETLAAVVTHDLRVVVWPLLPSGPDLSDQHIYNLPASPDNLAPDNFPFVPDAPLAFMPGNKLLVVNLFGGVVLLSGQAEELCTFNFPTHHVKSIKVSVLLLLNTIY